MAGHGRWAADEQYERYELPPSSGMLPVALKIRISLTSLMPNPHICQNECGWKEKFPRFTVPVNYALSLGFRKGASWLDSSVCLDLARWLMGEFI